MRRPRGYSTDSTPSRLTAWTNARTQPTLSPTASAIFGVLRPAFDRAMTSALRDVTPLLERRALITAACSASVRRRTYKAMAGALAQTLPSVKPKAHTDICKKALAAIAGHIKSSNRWVSQLARKDARAQLLATLPGIGEFSAVLLAMEIDEVRRFRRAEKLCAYAGLAPSTCASGGYVRHGRITKRGNKWIRWACVEAVYPAIRQDRDLAALYERLKATKGANVAKVAVAKRLLTIAYGC